MVVCTETIIQHLEKAIANDPDFIYSYIFKANIYRDEGKFDEAIKLY